MNKKLELKHLAPYLPYDLRVCHEDHIAIIMTFYLPAGNHNHDLWVVEMEDEKERYLSCSVNFKEVKPILRPLSDLTKEIEVDGEKFIPIIKMVAECHYWMDYYNQGLGKFGENIKSTRSKPIYNVGYGDMKIYWVVDFTYIPALDWQYIQKLFEWHFDVFGLIEKNLAININDI